MQAPQPNPATPQATVIVPSHARPRLVTACVRALARQSASAPFEVLVGFDGPEPDSAAMVRDAWREADPRNADLHVVEFPHRGANEIRQDLLDRARADLVIILNDDVAPEPGFIDAHANRQHRSRAAGHHDIVIGHSPDIDHPNPTLLDRVVARTSLVFPWPAMLAAHAREPGPNAEHDHGYRAAVTLNFSAWRADLQAVAGFTPSAGVYGHDDLELGHRMATHLGARVLFEPTARAPHDHRHTAQGLLTRDARLGASLWHYARARPAFARDLVGHDPTDADRLAFYRRWLDTDRRDARRTARTFLDLAQRPWGTVGDDPGDVVIRALGDQHLPARRWLWRRALVDAADAQRTGATLPTDHADRVLSELLD